MMKARSEDREMSQDAKGFALVTGASPGIGPIYADRLAKLPGQDPAQGFVERGGGTIINIASIVAVAPEILRYTSRGCSALRGWRT